MSFSFSFSGEDIDSSDREDASSTKDITKKLEDASITSKPNLSPAKRHTFADLLGSLPDQVSYDWVDIPVSPRNGGKIAMPRREIFDIRQQLMTEADPSADTDTTSTLLEGLQSGDLSTGVYEGGFKTWECAIDLAGYLHDLRYGKDQFDSIVIELGAGSAIPSLVLLAYALCFRQGHAPAPAEDNGRVIRFVLCDYNEDVLRLCTAVNIFILIVLNLADEHKVNLGDDSFDALDNSPSAQGWNETELTINKALTQRVLDHLRKLNIEIDFVSGAWGDEFVDVVIPQKSAPLANTGQGCRTLLLASETIYSPDIVSTFTKTLLAMVLRAKEQGQLPKTLIAAKKVYFGVGGGVAEFEEELDEQGGHANTVLDVQGAGVGRVILEVLAR